MDGWPPGERHNVVLKQLGTSALGIAHFQTRQQILLGDIVLFHAHRADEDGRALVKQFLQRGLLIAELFGIGLGRCLDAAIIQKHGQRVAAFHLLAAKCQRHIHTVAIIRRQVDEQRIVVTGKGGADAKKGDCGGCRGRFKLEHALSRVGWG
ncbi:hypothetical protein SAMN04487859_10636 [Roseovarius lutimaris]|uniref:Uncharacterized protein n=1 Tax=Roseovarius lutimaris TaxID=1005928 RepID=A0A1I5AJS7_9RHOB|nr:hypothetical protein [Roseovarius lutimaris]SFN62610.1 hypothetical protein SAMN04487859_10636 [Roseovarius lutimaris]